MRSAETGVDEFTFDALAARAGVSKATLYRRWSGKSELIAEAVRRRVGFFLREFDRQSFRGDVLYVLGEVTTWLVRDAAVLRTLTDAGRRDAALREAVERRLAWPLDAVGEGVLDRARGRGELRSDVDLSWLNELSQAVLFNRILRDRSGTALTSRAREPVKAHQHITSKEQYSSDSPTAAKNNTSVLVSGAGITAAHWLHRYGFDVTVAELAPALRRGGQAIDVRACAV